LVVILLDVGKGIMDLSEWLATPLLSIYDQSNQLLLLVCEKANAFAHYKMPDDVFSMVEQDYIT
jgi:hypothetical protein